MEIILNKLSYVEKKKSVREIKFFDNVNLVINQTI